MVEELILGDNPFIGVSHLSQEKAREEAVEASLEKRVEVFEAAVEGGCGGFTFSTHESNLELLAHFNSHDPELLSEMNYYILVPYSESYVRRVNVGGTPALIKSKLRDVLRSPSATLRILSAMMLMRPERLAGPFVEYEVAPYLRLLPEERVKAVFLHEILTELAVAFNLPELLTELDEYVRENLGASLGLETRNFGYLSRCMSDWGYCPEYLMTPFNPLGYQMAPDREAVEEAVEGLDGESRLIAINILASGALDLNGAIDYISNFQDKIYGVTTASTKPDRIRRNFQRLSQAFLP